MRKGTFTHFFALFFLWLCCNYTGMRAQDIHFSQFDYSPLNINPALTGVFQGDTRVMGNFRSQWYSVPVPYLTFSGALDFKLYDQRFRNTLFSGGVLFNHDRVGDGELALSSLGLSTSITQQLGSRNFLTAGVQFTLAQRGFDLGALSFDSQYDGDQYDPNLTTNESFDKTSNFHTLFAVGVNWHFQVPESRSRLDLGGAFHQPNQPQVSFLNDESVVLDSRIAGYFMGSTGMGDKMDLVLKFLMQLQGDYQEMVLGGGLKYYINQTRGRQVAIQLGAGYRLDDAVYPEMHLFVGPWTLGLSYDVNTSDFTVATNQSGGVEASLVYIFTKVRPIEKKICPIF